MDETVLYISQENMCTVLYTHTPIHAHALTHTHARAYMF